MTRIIWTTVMVQLSIILLTVKVVLVSPSVSQIMAQTPVRPVLVEIQPDISTLTALENPPRVLSSNSRGELPASRHANSTGNVTSSSTPVPALTGTKTTKPPMPKFNSSNSARFSNSQNTAPAVMLPLGSEGPNANRNTTISSVRATGTGLDAVVSPQSIVGQGRQPNATQNRRLEIRLIDFQMNRTGTVQENITQNITISVKFIAGSIPILAANEDLAVVKSSLPATIFHGNTSDTIHPNTTIVPQSTSGFQLIFNGTYQSNENQNKVTVNRIITAEQCGQLVQLDKGYLEVSVKPSPEINSDDKLSEGYYKCPVFLNYAPASQESDAFWSETGQCNSGELSNFSYRFWFSTRQYIIDAAACQNSLPVLDEHN